MPTNSELYSTLLLAVAYSASIAGVYAILRRSRFSTQLAFALSVPSTQAAFSFLFQLRFLLGLGLMGDALGWVAAASLGAVAIHFRSNTATDLARLVTFGRRYWWAAAPLALASGYGAFQALLLPPLNVDAVAYHLPRVFLFLQNETLFLESFSSYHQAVFPIGSDILYYPFIALGTDHGFALLSLSSYLAIGAGTFVIARCFTSRKRAALTVLILLSLDLIVLQSVVIKNDIIIAAVAASVLALTLKLRDARQIGSLVLLAVLCAFGLSAKLTFLAFIPGLAALIFIRLQLWQPQRVKAFFDAFLHERRFWLPALPVVLVLSQIWLFAYNANHYGSWKGPAAFTHRHEQHDGLIGMAANLMRYGMETIQAGYITDRYLAERLGLPQPTAVANEIYRTYFEPIFGSAGASREEFSITWANHNSFAWFGPLGAVIVYLFVPAALIRRKQTALVVLLPALGYLLIIAGKVSWMPWNGRFFTLLLVALTPAIAITLQAIRARLILVGLGVIALLQLGVTKVVDFERFLLPIASMIRSEIPLTPGNIYNQAVVLERNKWNPKHLESRIRYAPKRKVLENVPEGSRVGLYDIHHRQDFRFFHVRPDLYWRPIKFHRGYGELGLNQAVGYFLDSSLDYLVIYGEFEGVPPAPTVARSANGLITVLEKPN